jgi:hypothetical protein
MRKIFVLVFLLAVTFPTFAAEVGGTIKGLYVNESNLVLLTLSTPIPGGHACQQSKGSEPLIFEDDSSHRIGGLGGEFASYIF